MNFGNDIDEIQQKYEKERKRGRKKILNFGDHITEILAAQICWPKTNCGNAIAKIGKKIVAIMAMPLSKMGGKNNNNGCRNLGRN